MKAKVIFAIFFFSLQTLIFMIITMIIILNNIICKNINCENFIKDYILAKAKFEVIPKIYLRLNLITK